MNKYIEFTNLAISKLNDPTRSTSTTITQLKSTIHPNTKLHYYNGCIYSYYNMVFVLYNYNGLIVSVKCEDLIVEAVVADNYIYVSVSGVIIKYNIVGKEVYRYYIDKDINKIYSLENRIFMVSNNGIYELDIVNNEVNHVYTSKYNILNIILISNYLYILNNNNIDIYNFNINMVASYNISTCYDWKIFIYNDNIGIFLIHNNSIGWYNLSSEMSSLTCIRTLNDIKDYKCCEIIKLNNEVILSCLLGTRILHVKTINNQITTQSFELENPLICGGVLNYSTSMFAYFGISNTSTLSVSTYLTPAYSALETFSVFAPFAILEEKAAHSLFTRSGLIAPTARSSDSSLFNFLLPTFSSSILSSFISEQYQDGLDLHYVVPDPSLLVSRLSDAWEDIQGRFGLETMQSLTIAKVSKNNDSKGVDWYWDMVCGLHHLFLNLCNTRSMTAASNSVCKSQLKQIMSLLQVLQQLKFIQNDNYNLGGFCNWLCSLEKDNFHQCSQLAQNNRILRQSHSAKLKEELGISLDELDKLFVDSLISNYPPTSSFLLFSSFQNPEFLFYLLVEYFCCNSNVKVKIAALKEFAMEFTISEKRSIDLCNYFYLDKALGNAPENIKQVSGFGSEHTHVVLLASCWALKEYKLAINLSQSWGNNESSEVTVLHVLVRLESHHLADALKKMRENAHMHCRLFNSSLQWLKIYKQLYEWMKLPLNSLEIKWFVNFLAESDEDRDALITYLFLKGKIAEGVAEYLKYDNPALCSIPANIIENYKRLHFGDIESNILPLKTAIRTPLPSKIGKKRILTPFHSSLMKSKDSEDYDDIRLLAEKRTKLNL